MDTGFVISSDKTGCVCPNRTYLNASNSSCVGCPFDCLTCDANNTNNCLSCNEETDHRQFDSATSRCLPKTGFYESNTTVAGTCPSACIECTSLTVCTNCKTGSYHYNQLCFSECPQRFFTDSANKKCVPCLYDCQSCDGSGNCLSCNETVDFRTL